MASETSSEKAIRKIQRNVGWSDRTLIHLLGRWIDFGNRDGSFESWLSEEAAAEEKWAEDDDEI